MDKLRLLKNIDKIAGTPACFLIGKIDNLFSNKNSLPAEPKKILIIKLIAVGDLVVALPTFRAIKESFPKCHLAVLINPRVRNVVEGFPYLDEIISYDILGKDKGVKRFFQLINRLRKKRFDLILDLEQYYRITTLIAYLSGTEGRIGFDLRKQGRNHLFKVKVPYLINKNEVEAFLEIANRIGAITGERKLEEIWVSVEDKKYVDEFFKDNGILLDDLIIGIHPGTGPSATSRRWQTEKFGALADWLIDELKAKVIFTGSPKEISMIHEIIENMKLKPIIATGKTSLKQLAEISRRCKLFISVDTGPLHIAAAMGTKVIGLYGPNTPVKWGPYGEGHISIYKGLKCSPCTKQYLGQISNCKDPICMKSITVEDVKSAVQQMLKTTLASI